MGKKEIVVGSDHAGFELKERIKNRFLKKGYKVFDVGAHFYEKKDDYPIFAEKLGQEIARRKMMGLLFCGSGEGMCIAANKVKGVRAIAGFNKEVVKLSREHNDSNVLCLSGWMMKENEVMKIIDVWMKTRFSGAERHIRRLAQIKSMEGK